MIDTDLAAPATLSNLLNMPLKIQYQPNDVCALRISGILKQSEFGAEQSALSRRIETGAKPRLLVILENFEGWERGADWNDLDFLLSYSHKIMKIAIVAERRWEILALAFAGAGFRLGQLSFLRLTNWKRRKAG